MTCESESRGGSAEDDLHYMYAFCHWRLAIVHIATWLLTLAIVYDGLDERTSSEVEVGVREICMPWSRYLAGLEAVKESEPHA